MKYSQKIWDDIIGAIYKMRGINNYRGKDIRFQDRGVILLETEKRRSELIHGYIEIIVGKDLDTTKFIVHGDKLREVRMQEFKDIEGFVSEACSIARQNSEYFKTPSGG